jgi:hypothetical protein
MYVKRWKQTVAIVTEELPFGGSELTGITNLLLHTLPYTFLCFLSLKNKRNNGKKKNLPSRLFELFAPTSKRTQFQRGLTGEFPRIFIAL